MKIRPATLSDVDSLVALNRYVQDIHAIAHPALFRCDTPSDQTAAAFQAMIADKTALWLLAESDRPLGYLYAQFHDRPQSWFRPATRVCNISHLAIHPAHRRQGLGHSLINALAVIATTREFTRIELDVWLFNQDARKAFRRLGFSVFNERMVLQPPESSGSR